VKIEKRVIPIKQLTDKINLDADYLVSRQDGALFAKHLIEVLGCLPSTTVTMLDFAEVELMDGSFADEAFGTIAASRSRKDLQLPSFGLYQLNSESRDNLKHALLSRPVREKGIRNCVIALFSQNDMVELCGKCEDHVRQTFELLNKHAQLNTSAMCDLLELGTTAASTRLKVLHNLGLAVRIEVRDVQGKQFLYYTIT
jgi:hypothetical protein